MEIMVSLITLIFVNSELFLYNCNCMCLKIVLFLKKKKYKLLYFFLLGKVILYAGDGC